MLGGADEGDGQDLACVVEVPGDNGWTSCMNDIDRMNRRGEDGVRSGRKKSSPKKGKCDLLGRLGWKRRLAASTQQRPDLAV